MAEENPTSPGPKASNESVGGQPPLSSTGPASGSPRRYTRSRRRAYILILLVVLLVGVGGVFFWRYLSSYESTDDAQVDVHLYPVSARISGYVIRVNVDDNQFE